MTIDLAHLFATGRIVDMLLALVAVEACVLILLWCASGRGIAPLPLLANLTAGAMLMLALRSALTASHWSVTAFYLLGALAGHGADIALRWRR